MTGSGQVAAPQQRSTRLVLLLIGLASGAWAPLVPFAKARVGIDEAVLGLLLFCLGLGSMVAMPIAGALAARFGCRRVIVPASLLVCLALPLMATASSLPLLVAALVAFGAGVSAVDVTVNIQAIIVERASGRPMMSGFHGYYSLGGILGAAGLAGALTAGASPLAATAAAIAVIAMVLALAAPHLLPWGGERSGPDFAFPRGVVWFIGGLCFIVFLTEGSVLDWSAVFLSSVRGVAKSQAGLGYAAFALAMTTGRFLGDRLVGRLGGAAIIGLGGLIAAAGFALATLVPWWGAALVGYGLVGTGCSNIVPVLFTAIGRQTDQAEPLAVPAVTTLGYAGILAGPAAIGFVAHAASLTAAFLILAALLLCVAASGRWLRV